MYTTYKQCDDVVCNVGGRPEGTPPPFSSRSLAAEYL